jgi:hypothetical protein
MPEQCWESAKYKVESWDWRDDHIVEIVASVSLVLIGHAAGSERTPNIPQFNFSDN